MFTHQEQDKKQTLDWGREGISERYEEYHDAL